MPKGYWANKLTYTTSTAHHPSQVLQQPKGCIPQARNQSKCCDLDTTPLQPSTAHTSKSRTAATKRCLTVGGPDRVGRDELQRDVVAKHVRDLVLHGAVLAR